MFEWFQAGLEAQKRLIDLQSRQIQVLETMLKGSPMQAPWGKIGEAQNQVLNNWLSLWGVKR